MPQNTAIVTVEDNKELVCDLSHGAISSDIQWSLTYFKVMILFYSTSNNWKMVQTNSRIYYVI